ncbi:TPA: DDE-type integrase/transposase/recombinase, partial [Shigella sonnei]
VKESNQRWCSDGFEFRCDNGEKLRVTFALDCCDREALHWAVTTGGFNSETVQDVMLGAVERRFGNELPASPVEWLTDNGSCYRANETRQFARMLGLEPKSTAVRSPESNGIAESFVKTIKRDYISVMPKPDGLTAAKNLAVTSIFITMMLIWLLLSVTSVLTLKQYAQKNLALTAAT